MPNTPINFVISDFETSIRLQQDVQTWSSESDTISASFILSADIPVSVMKNLFMFSTDEISHVLQTENVEDVNFLIDSTVWADHDPSFLSLYSATSETLTISDYNTLAENNTLTTYLSWLMFKITRIPDSMVLVKNDMSVAENMNRLFKHYVWNNMILSKLWAQDFRRSPKYDDSNVAIDNPTVETFAVPTTSVDFLDANNTAATVVSSPNLHAFTGSTTYSVMPYSKTHSDPTTFPIAQKIFEVLVKKDLSRLRDLNPMALMDNDALVNDSKIYKFPFIPEDTIEFKLNLKVPYNNVLNMFGGDANLTPSMRDLNTSLNEADTDSVNYVSYHIKYRLV